MPRSGSGFRVLRLAGALAAGLAACAAAASGQATGRTVAGLAVLVDGREADTEIAGLVGLRPGEPLSLKGIDDAVQRLWLSGLFSDIRVEDDGGSAARLTFRLDRRLSVRSLTFERTTGLSRRALLDGLTSLRPDGEFTEGRLERAVEDLRRTLRAEGYFEAVIQPRAVRREGTPSMDVTFGIEAGPRLAIERVEIEGAPGVAPSTLAGMIESRVGEAFVPKALEADAEVLRAFVAGRGYPRAEVVVDEPALDEARGTAALRFVVRPGERIRILIRGARVPEAEVRPIWEERVFEDWAVVQSEAKVLSYLRERGYVFATAKSAVERGDGEIRVVHDVHPGRRYRITDVLFEGQTAVSAEELRRELGLGPVIPFLAGIDGKRLYELPDEIAGLLRGLGFPSARVDLSFRRIESDMVAICQIEEGPRQTIGRLDVRGTSLFEPAALRAEIRSREGGPYVPNAVRRDAEALETYYLNQGVRGTAVTSSVEPRGGDVFDVTYDVREGRRVRVGRVFVTGYEVTRRATIDREIRIRAGDWARSDLILETRRNLERLGLFTEVKIEEIPAGEDAENVVIGLREGSRNYVSFGLGLETKAEPQGFAVWDSVIRPRGTAEFIRGNMFGRAAQLSLVAQFSLKEKRGVVSWEEPRLFGWDVQTSLIAYLEREERISFGYDRRGVNLSGAKPVFGRWVSMTSLRWTSTTLYFLDIAENEIDRQFSPFSATSISESLVRDGRDDAFNPTRGSFFSAVVEWAYPLLAAESDFIKGYVKSQNYFPLLPWLEASLTARGGLALGKIPIHERFFGGGSSSFRGRPFDELGPKDPASGKPVGGKAVVMINFELAFPLLASLSNLRGAFFYDKGGIFASRSDFRPGSMEDAIGLGLRYRTPLGPLRFELGWNLNPVDGRKQPLVFITIGNVF